MSDSAIRTVDLLKTQYQLSDADADKNLCASLITFDCFATYFVRYPDVFVNPAPTFAGPVIIYLAAHIFLACGIIAILFAIAAFVVWRMQENRKKDFNQSQKNLKTLIENINPRILKPKTSNSAESVSYLTYTELSDSGPESLTEKDFADLLGSDFATVKGIVSPLFEQCEAINFTYNHEMRKITACSVELKQEPDPGFLTKTFRFSDVVGMISWLYWLSWLPAGIFYGSFASIVVTPVLIAIPLLLYFGFVVYKRMKNDQCRQKEQASYLITYVNTLLVFLQRKNNLANRDADGDREVSSESESMFKMRKLRCGLAQFLRRFVSMFITLEFCAWYLADAGKTCLIPFSHILFGLMMAHPLVFCGAMVLISFMLFAAHKSFQSSDLYKSFLPMVISGARSVLVCCILAGVFLFLAASSPGSWLAVSVFLVLSVIHACVGAKQKVDNLTHTSNMPLLQEFYNTSAGSTWQNVVHGIKDFFASAMTGILFSRMLLIPGTANFAPWLQHVELSGPSLKIILSFLTSGTIFSALTVFNNVTTRAEKWRMQNFVSDFVKSLPEENSAGVGGSCARDANLHGRDYDNEFTCLGLFGGSS